MAKHREKRHYRDGTPTPPNMAYYQQQQYYYQYQQQQLALPPPPQLRPPATAMAPRPVRRKALLIGIDYFGTKNQLRGCINDVQNMSLFLVSRGYDPSPRNMVFLTDERQGPYYPSAHNILAAMDWLVSEPNCCLFLHYSGHGGQVPDDTGDRASGFDDTIVPVDWERNGMITSDTLHRHLVTALPRDSTLFIMFDCCHSGSAVELPYVYRTDGDGNINLMDNVQAGMHLMGEASHLIQGGFSFNSIGQAAQLLGGAKDFFQGLKHQYYDEPEPDGLVAAQDFDADWAREGKSVFMFSGCRDDQTSADAYIGGKSVGAMSWAFLETMKQDYHWNFSYVEILQRSRQLLQRRYSQVPQLSCGYPFDLNKPLRV